MFVDGDIGYKLWVTMSNYVKGKNPFFEEEDVDDDAFLRHPKAGGSGYMLPQYNSQDLERQRKEEDKRQQLLMEKKRIEQSTLASSNRSLGLLHESEAIGVETAQDLIRQREQLENVDKNLDNINSNLRISQNHVQSIKSVFGSIKNYFNKTPTQPLKTVSESNMPKSNSSSNMSSGLRNAVNNADLAKPSTAHPGERIRGFDDYEDAGSNVDAQVDKNLEDMCAGLTRLKGLASGLSTEIDEQNELLNHITYKAESTDWKVDKQNKELNKLLKK